MEDEKSNKLNKNKLRGSNYEHQETKKEEIY
jgi:hypothetical protein